MTERMNERESYCKPLRIPRTWLTAGDKFFDPLFQLQDRVSNEDYRKFEQQLDALLRRGDLPEVDDVPDEEKNLVSHARWLKTLKGQRLRATAYAMLLRAQVDLKDDQHHRIMPDGVYYIPQAPTRKNKKADLLEENTAFRELIPGFQMPETQTVAEFIEHPTFPIMAKMFNQNGGIGKFKLSGDSQADRFLKFLAQDEQNSGDLAKRFVMQQYIAAPIRNTSYRVLVAANGEVLASTLNYSGKDDGEAVLVPEDIYPFYDPSSEFYLGNEQRQMISQSKWGGGQIVLNPNAYSKPREAGEAEILAAHGLDETDPQLPEALRERSAQIAQILAVVRGGFNFGVDWIQDAATGEFYFLEANSEPGHLAYYNLYKQLFDSNNYQFTGYIGDDISQILLQNTMGSLAVCPAKKLFS